MGGVMFSALSQRRKQTSRDREHLVDLERSEQIYLVIRDHSKNMRKTFALFQLIPRVNSLGDCLRENRSPIELDCKCNEII